MGEFKRRIEEAYNWVMNEKPEGNRCLYDPPTFVLAQAMKIVEEAKKEFPIQLMQEIEHGKIWSRFKPTLDRKKAHHVSLDIEKTLDWFERWFGE